MGTIPPDDPRLSVPPTLHERPTIRCFLDLSTAHLDEASKEWLTNEAKDSSTYEGCYGWFTAVYPADEELDGIAVNPDRPGVLTAILKYAVKLGCDYVLFDADGDFVEDLPIFED